MADEQNTTVDTSSTTDSNYQALASGRLTKELDTAFREHKEVTQPQTEESATSDTSKETESGPNGKSASAAEAGKDQKQERGKKGAEERIAQLTAREKAALEEVERLKARNAELEKGAPKTEAKPAEVQAPPKLEKPVRPKRPSLNDEKFKSMDDYEAAVQKYEDEELPAYEEKLAEYNRKLAVQEFQQTTQQQEHSKIVKAQLDEAKQVYSDWDGVGKVAVTAVVGDGKPETGAHPAVQQAISNSPVMAHLLYALGKDEKLSDFVARSRQNPIEALMDLGVRQFLITEELAKAKTDKGDKGEKKDTASAKTKAQEPPAKPNNEVGNRGTGPSDVAADAVRRGDFRTAEAEWTRRHAQKRGLTN